MELLLNLGWLLLAVPALWLWRESSRMPSRRGFSALQVVFCLGCALVILFPVVSATDDLRAMRAEMEETPISKRSVGQSNGERVSAARSQVQPAIVFAAYTPVTLKRGWVLIVSHPISIPASPTVIRAGRAPPQSAVS